MLRPGMSVVVSVDTKPGAPHQQEPDERHVRPNVN